MIRDAFQILDPIDAFIGLCLVAAIALLLVRLGA